MELRLKPTGFTAIAGRARSHMQFGRRITGNTLKL
jgi:hypothetical protein